MATGSHKVSIVVGVKNLASPALNSIQKTFTSMQKTIATTGTFLGAFNRNLDATIHKMDRLANSMYKFNMYTSSLQRNITNVGVIGGVAAGGIAYQGTNNALQYDYKTHIMQSRMETTSQVRKQISDYILKDLNMKVGYNPSELADMGIILGQAGVNNTKDMKSMLKTVSYFSEAVDAAPEQAAEMVISAAKGFNISMENSSQITDKLTVALNKSLLHVEEMPHAIGELAGRAAMYGQTLDSSLVALMTMRDQGMPAAQASQDLLHTLKQGSRAGNSEMLFKRTAGWFKQLGIDEGIFNKDTRKLKEFPELVADLEKAMVKGGFVNPKYNIKTQKDYYDFIAKNGGKAPDDFWDSMKANPLLTKIFGAAGLAPIAMGLQTKYEEVDKKTGEKTGQVFYGSEALKKMYNDVKNSDGAVEKTHDIISNSGLFQLKVLGGAWEAVQTDFLTEIIPIIKTGAEQLSDWLGGNKQGSGFQKFDEAIKEAAQNLRDRGNPGTAEFVETAGTGIMNGVKISGTMPSMFKQISQAFNENFVKSDWGSNIVEFPFHIVKNGIGFINDLLKANEEFQAAVAKLPKDLQDPAKLVETLTKGGIVLLVTGAVVKTIELGVRGVSAAMKGTKIVTSLTEAIIKLFTGGGKNPGVGGVVGNALKTVTMTAGVVNIYTGAVNNGGPGIPPGGSGNKSNKAPSKKVSTLSKGAAFLKNGIPIAIATDIASGAMGGPSLTKSAMESKYNPLNPHIDEKVEKINNVMKNPTKLGGEEAKIVPVTEGDIVEKFKTAIKEFFTPKKVEQPANAATNPYVAAGIPVPGRLKSMLDKEILEGYKTYPFTEKPDVTQSILSGFNSANEKIQNLKLQNNLSVNVAPPQINITGNIKDAINVTTNGSSSFTMRENSNQSAGDRNSNIMQRRLGWR